MATSKKMRAIAHHEAGHAVMACLLRVPFRHVTINPEGDALGHVLHAPVPDWMQPDLVFDARTRRWLEGRIMTAWAGPLAEERFTGRFNDTGASDDLDSIGLWVSHSCGSTEEEETFVAWLRVRTGNTLGNPIHWAWVEATADALIRERTLTKRAVNQLKTERLQRAGLQPESS